MQTMIAAATTAALMSSAVAAPSVFQFDVNFTTATISGATTSAGFDTFTGSITAADDGDSTLDGTSSDDTSFEKFASANFDYSLRMDFVNGAITSGAIFIQVANGDTFTADLVANSQGVILNSGRLTVDANTTNNDFVDGDADGMFGPNGAGATIPVPSLDLSGNVIQFFFEVGNIFAAANAAIAATDTSVDTDIIVAIPLPTGGLLAAAGLGLVATRRVRR